MRPQLVSGFKPSTKKLCPKLSLYSLGWLFAHLWIIALTQLNYTKDMLNAVYSQCFIYVHAYIICSSFFLHTKLPVVSSLAKKKILLIFILILEKGWWQKTVIVEMLQPTLQQIITPFSGDKWHPSSLSTPFFHPFYPFFQFSNI